MAKTPTFNPVTNRDANASEINDAIQSVADQFEEVLFRDGETPNEMNADLDLNSNDVVNGGVGNFTNVVVDGSDLTDSIQRAEDAADDAEASAAAAAISEANAATSASNAATSEANAAASAQAAADLYDDFDDRYLGPKATPPTLDNDGDPIQEGALYYNTTMNIMYVWNGSSWDNIAGAIDHGALIGLGDDDHPQYHNDTRGDLRYYTQAQVDSKDAVVQGNLDTHIADTGNPHDTSWANLLGKPTLITDHGDLTGLADDDHPQYHNDTRGDARYVKNIGDEMTGALLMTGASLGTIELQRGGTGQKWGVGTTSDQTSVTIYDFDAAEIAARFNVGGTDVPSSTTIITAEKGDPRYVHTPTAFGASEAGSDTTNDAVFATMETNLGDRVVDLEGKTWPVTHVPNLNARNGYWLVTNFSQSMDVRLAARDTREMSILGIEGGKTTIAWAQDVYSAYNGVMIGGYMPADGHDPGSQDWTVFRITEHGRNIADFEPRQNFGSTDENEVFAATVVPPSTVGGSYDGAFQLAVVRQGSTATEMFHRPLAEYVQDSASGGLEQAQGDWDRTTFGGQSFSTALRAEVDAQYSVTTSGLPTLVHGLTLHGSSGGDGGNGNVFFGFHGLSGYSRPCIGYVDNGPKSGSGDIEWVANVGGLSEGVEPVACWFKNGSVNSLCGFVRSQGTGYPIRFWASSSLTQAAVEGAATQDCPGGNDFGTYSPILCRMRPRRKGSVSGWIVTDETLDGDTDDELHFTFTDTRDRDGGPGEVWLYHGKVTRGSGNFDDMWDRAEITAIYPLYFSNSNSTDTSNQVGVSSMAFIDSNTLVIGASTMRPAISGDEDEAMLLNFVIKLDDDYADTSERRQWDDGTQVPMDVFRAPEFVNYRGDRVALGERVTKVIFSGSVDYTGQGNIVLAPQSGTVDTIGTIFNGRDGDIVTLRSDSSANTITVVNGTGNFALDTSLGNFVLDNARDRITLIYDSGSAEWVEISRSNNGT